MIELNLITNEKIFKKKRSFYCDNIEIKLLIEELGKYFNANLFCRNSNQKRFHKIKFKKIIHNKNLFCYLLNIFKKFKNTNSKFLLISITPYTFICFLFLYIFNKKKIYLYLRSNGFEEYKKIFGIFGKFLYGIMFFLVTPNVKIISNNKNIIKTKKFSIVQPSLLDNNWKRKFKKINLDKIKLLYVGRVKVEKGIYSLIDLIKKIKQNITLTIVGCENNQHFDKISKIRFFKIVHNRKKLINYYDKHLIFILPSFTEAYGMVIDEALSRGRPVIIFEEIKNVIGNRKGIFVCRRNHIDLEKLIFFIINNYSKIKKQILENKLPDKKKYIDNLVKFLI